jgi:hypothetical protein
MVSPAISCNTAFEAAVGQAFGCPCVENGALSKEESEILVRVLTSPHVSVVRSGFNATNALAREYPRLALDLLKHVNLALDTSLADEALMLFHFGQVLSTLTEFDVDHILAWISTEANHPNAER